MLNKNGKSKKTLNIRIELMMLPSIVLKIMLCYYFLHITYHSIVNYLTREKIRNNAVSKEKIENEALLLFRFKIEVESKEILESEEKIKETIISLVHLLYKSRSHGQEIQL